MTETSPITVSTTLKKFIILLPFVNYVSQFVSCFVFFFQKSTSYSLSLNAHRLLYR